MAQQTKSTVLLKHHLKQLKLPTMLAECEKIAARAAKDNLDHLAYLLQLCGKRSRLVINYLANFSDRR